MEHTLGILVWRKAYDVTLARHETCPLGGRVRLDNAIVVTTV
jgi:hypothetical protein